MAQTKEERVQRGIEYRKHHVRQVKFDFSIEYDADILAHLDAQKNRQGYIKDLIRADIARANSDKMKEDSTMKYEIKATSSALPIDAQKSALLIHTAQNPDDPGVPSGGNPWYAVQTDPTDDWSTGSFDLDEAKSMARNLRKDHPDALIAVIDNTLENPFCIDEIRDF